MKELLVAQKKAKIKYNAFVFLILLNLSMIDFEFSFNPVEITSLGMVGLLMAGMSQGLSDFFGNEFETLTVTLN